jgi:DNA-binding response OmpR family regulator
VNSGARILVVEDEPNVGRTLSERLAAEGYRVTWVKTAAEAQAEDAQEPAALALLDVGLPDESGFELAAGIRRRHPQTAIVFVTAFGTPEDRVRGLELGAEDYIVKPFHFKELLLRIQNALRRAMLLSETESRFERPLRVGRARIDLKRMEVQTDERTVTLTHKECAVLTLLLEKQGAVLARDEILDRAWAPDEFPTPRTVDNFIVRLRRLIEPDPGEPQVIRSIRGVGYQLDVHAVREAEA